MESQASDRKLAVTRNKGILGQEVIHIKNGDCFWSLRNIEEKLWGRSSLDGGQSWTDWATLLTGYNGYFSFTVSQDEKLHLTCKNKEGALIYLFWQGENIDVDVLGKNWIEEEKVTFQTILVDGTGTVNLIFFTDNPLDEIWRIKYCLKNNDGWSLPEIIEQGLGQGQNQGAAAIDPGGTIHLIYQIFNNDKYQFVYREKALDTNKWHERIAITDAKRNNLYPCMVIDKRGTIHLTWVRSDGMNYRVMYRRKTKGGWMVGGWQREAYLSATGVNAYTPTIGVLEDEVIVLWQQTEGIYQASSFDEGKTFNEPVLKNQYHKLIYKNLLDLDLYKKQGLNIMETFDTGSTSVALLAAAFQSSSDHEDKEVNLSLPEVQKKQEFILPSMEYLSLDFGQKGMEEYLKKINGNFHRLFFETEDVRLTNMQMKETIEENTATISALENDLSAKEQELNKIKKQEQSLQSVIKILKDNIADISPKLGLVEKENLLLEKKCKVLIKEKEEAEQNLKNTEPVIQRVEQRLKEKEAELAMVKEKDGQLQNKFKELINEKDLVIKQMEETAKKLTIKIEALEKQPIWKKLFK